MESQKTTGARFAREVYMRQFTKHILFLLFFGGLCVFVLSGCGSDDEDIEAPSLTLNSLQDQNANTTGTPTFKVDGQASLLLSGTVESGTIVEVEANDGEAIPAEVSGQAWQLTLDTALLDEGSNVLAISAEDSVGNTRTLNFFVVKDTTGPAISFDQYLTPDTDGVQTIGGTVAVGSTVDVFVDGELAGQADVEGGLWSYPLDLSGAADGTYGVSVIGYDELGNPSAQLDQSIVKDGTAPLLSVDQDSLAWTTASTLTVSGTVGDGLVPEVLPVGTEDVTVGSPIVDSAADPDSWTAGLENLPSGATLVSVSVDDGAGNAAEAGVIAYRDLRAPAVIANTPGYGEVLASLPADFAVTVTFSEEMLASSVETADVATAESPAMTLVDAEGALVNGDITYDPQTRTATYTPDPLEFGQTYTATVSSAVSDARGNPLGANYTWTFRTQ